MQNKHHESLSNTASFLLVFYSLENVQQKMWSLVNAVSLLLFLLFGLLLMVFSGLFHFCQVLSIVSTSRQYIKKSRFAKLGTFKVLAGQLNCYSFCAEVDQCLKCLTDRSGLRV